MAWGKYDQLIYVSHSTNTVVVRLGGGEENSALWQFAIRALIRSIP